MLATTIAHRHEKDNKSWSLKMHKWKDDKHKAIAFADVTMWSMTHYRHGNRLLPFNFTDLLDNKLIKHDARLWRELQKTAEGKMDTLNQTLKASMAVDDTKFTLTAKHALLAREADLQLTKNGKVTLALSVDAVLTKESSESEVLAGSGAGAGAGAGAGIGIGVGLGNAVSSSPASTASTGDRKPLRICAIDPGMCLCCHCLPCLFHSRCSCCIVADA